MGAAWSLAELRCESRRGRNRHTCVAAAGRAAHAENWSGADHGPRPLFGSSRGRAMCTLWAASAHGRAGPGMSLQYTEKRNTVFI